MTFACLFLLSCTEPPSDTPKSFEKTLLEQLITASPGSTINIPEGRFTISRALSLKIDGVTIKGKGMDKSILSFAAQIQGSEGLIVTADNVTLQDFAIEDTSGDAVKVNECRDLIIRRVRVEWTNGPDVNNGAYGLYPVQCENVLIDEAVAIGASDAGIYVGQSNNVIVKNSRAEFNVAGIEIENTSNADVFGNTATNNTGGILVFNMPNLPVPGKATRVFRNRIISNNTPNFALPGSAVSGVPTGAGIVINSNDEVEIFDNEISDNDTANILISSFFSTGYTDRSTSEDFDPYPESIFIYDNQFSGGGTSPARQELKDLKASNYPDGSLPDVIWDGVVNAALLENGVLPPARSICVRNEGVVVLNIDRSNDHANVTEEMDTHDCEFPLLPAISLSLETESTGR